MSTGSIIGAVVGGVIGFFIGGPAGAYYGIAIGFFIGMIVDPITPDVPTIGAPADVQENVMSSTVGSPIKDVLGTGKITGHLLCYGEERSYTVPQQQQSGGKGGGGDIAQIGADEAQPGSTTYWMTWALGLCVGPVDALYAVYKENDLVWDGKLELPVSGGQETITLDGLGSCTFYFGTDDQVANPIINKLIPDSTLNTPWRNFCWALLDDCRIGNYNRTPTLSFMIGKHPVFTFSEHNSIQEYDYNPAHAMWYVLHNLAGLPTSWLNESAFAILAGTLVSEFRGISVLFSEQKKVIEYLTSMVIHIDCILNYDSEGKFTPKLIRDDYDVDTIPLIDENVMLDHPTIDRKSWIDTVSEIKVQYTELIDVHRRKGNLIYSAGRNSGYVLIRSDITAYAESFAMIDFNILYSSVSLGNGSAAVVSAYGILSVIGLNTTGHLGVGESTDTIEELTEVMYGCYSVEVSDTGSTYVIKTDGSLWSCGSNTLGQLGLGDLVERREFELVSTGPWKKITANYYSVVALHLDGTLWGCGWNGNGQLGLGPDGLGSYSLLTPISFAQNQDAIPITFPIPTFVDISFGIGSPFVLGITGNGDIYATGSNTNGRCCLDSDIGQFNYFTDRGDGGGWEKVVAGDHHSVVLNRNGDIYTCGHNFFGQLGDGTYVNNKTLTKIGTNKWIDISAGAGFTMAVQDSNNLFATGNNQYGRLGIGAANINKVNVFTAVDGTSEGKVEGVICGNSFVYAAIKR